MRFHKILGAIPALTLLCWGAEPARLTVSEELSPLQVVSVPTQGGRGSTPVVIRRPHGTKAAPAVIYLHGGLDTQSVERLKEVSRGPDTMTRFLAAGWITVVPTFRARNVDPQTREALLDCLD